MEDIKKVEADASKDSEKNAEKSQDVVMKEEKADS